MGTYINITGYIEFNTEDRPKMLQALKDLNRLDKAKRGGSFAEGRERQVWFSWMPEKYDEEVESVEDVFRLLLENVVVETTQRGTEMFHFHYDNKWGQHEPFFFAIAPYLVDMHIDHFCSEFEPENAQWLIVLDKKNKTAHTLYPKVTIEYPAPSEENLCTVQSYIDEMNQYWR